MSESLGQLSGEVSLVEGTGVRPNSRYADVLRGAGLGAFDEWWSAGADDVVKVRPDRDVRRIVLCGHSMVPALYLKRHYAAVPGVDEARRGGGAAASHGVPELFRRTEGGREFYNLCAFRACGLSTADPVAVGCRDLPDGRLESFCVTADHAPYVALEHLVLTRDAVLNSADVRTRVLEAVATYARSMHTAGMNHCDFNATHILLHGCGTPGPVAVALFDLQRVDRGRLRRLHWPVKSAAELFYTLRDSPFSEEERRAFMLTYRREPSLSLAGRLQRWLIHLKEARIARHQERKYARRQARESLDS